MRKIYLLLLCSLTLSCSAIYKTTMLDPVSENEPVQIMYNVNSGKGFSNNVSAMSKTYIIHRPSSMWYVSEPIRPKIPILVGPAYVPVIPNIIQLLPIKKNYDTRFFLDIRFVGADSTRVQMLLNTLLFSLNGKEFAPADSLYLVTDVKIIGKPRQTVSLSKNGLNPLVSPESTIRNEDTMHTIRFLFSNMDASKIKKVELSLKDHNDQIILALKRKLKLIYLPFWWD